ncbi:HNH endonuclease [uncultured Pseudodesulfovibrio sp.]|uniref:HNH endonuclease n=1 Tax=uncultured Pseudodesulfovibrio sp. TaxID=2035858 RepID=UPI00374A7479
MMTTQLILAMLIVCAALFLTGKFWDKFTPKDSSSPTRPKNVNVEEPIRRKTLEEMTEWEQSAFLRKKARFERKHPKKVIPMPQKDLTGINSNSGYSPPPPSFFSAQPKTKFSDSPIQTEWTNGGSGIWGSCGGPTAGMDVPEDIRKEVLLADNTTHSPCCGKQYGTNYESGSRVLMRGKDVDHIFPKSKGGNTTLTNLQVICSRCNRAKGDRVFFRWKSYVKQSCRPLAPSMKR